MGTLYTILTILVIIASVFVTLIVLLQNSKGGGLASNFVAGNQAFGVRQTADILEKITWGLAIFIFAISVATVFVKEDKVKAGESNTKGVKELLEKNQTMASDAVDGANLNTVAMPAASAEAPVEAPAETPAQ